MLLALLLPTWDHATSSAKYFGGVGINGTPWAEGGIVVKQLVSGEPAQQADIQFGDIITHIDGNPTERSDFRHMVGHRLGG